MRTIMAGADPELLTHSEIGYVKRIAQPRASGATLRNFIAPGNPGPPCPDSAAAAPTSMPARAAFAREARLRRALTFEVTRANAEQYENNNRKCRGFWGLVSHNPCEAAGSVGCTSVACYSFERWPTSRTQSCNDNSAAREPLPARGQ